MSTNNTQHLEGYSILEEFDFAEFNILFHLMNNKSNFAHGFTSQVAERYPQIIVEDELYHSHESIQDMGFTVSVIPPRGDESTPRFIVSIYALRDERNKKGSYLNKKKLRKILRRVNRAIGDKNIIGTVKFGTAFVGDDWNVVEDIISDEIASTLYVY